MQRSHRRFRDRSATGSGSRIAATALASGFACIVVACGGGSDGATPRFGTPATVICPGIVGDAAKLAAHFVSPQGSDDGNCTVYAPCRTIGRALSLFDFVDLPLLLRHGLYQTTETIHLEYGIGLYGSCLFDGEPDRKYRTVIQANPVPGTPAISAGPYAIVSGVVVIGKDETASGAPSVAMTVANANNVTLRRTVLVAGKGGPGAIRSPPGVSRLPVPLPAAARSGNDRCYTPGGAASDSLWGQVDLGNFTWVAGIGGAGAGGAYDTGPGGVGGQQGGASIGLLLVNSAVVTIVPDEFIRIVGGIGGDGGAGQAGPSFGLGGGANSGGAGGNGGPSIGVASINSASLPSGGAYIYASAPGGPGAPGAAGIDLGQCQADSGSPGVKGGSATVYQYPIPSTLTPGESLAGGQSLYSPNLRFQLILRDDSNLCLVSAGNPLWCSQTQGQGIYQAIMQSDGNFCMYETRGQFLPICSGTARPGARLTVQDSGHAQVIETNGAVLWSVPP